MEEVKVEETKTPVQLGVTEPEPQKTEEIKTIGDEPVLNERDKLRMSVEEKIVGEPAPLPPEIKEEVKEEVKTEKVEEVDATERLKAKIEKRIGKEVAKRKTLEEQLAEKDAEIERLKSGVKPDVKKEEREPTLQEIASALKKARDDGDTQFEVEILDYMSERKAKKERAEAEKQFEQRNSQVTERQRKWFEIVQDYTVVDEGGKEIKDHPLNLANPQSQLYKTANALYLDPELKKMRYSSGTEMENLRRAISDAYIELSKMGVEKKPETIQDGKTAKERMKTALVEPSAAKEETSEPRTPAKPKNDQEKVFDEVRSRVKWKRDREAALI